MVGHAMTRTGLLGVPFEYLNPVNLSEWQKRLGVLGPEATLREIRKRRTSGNGVFGLKAHFSHCDILGRAPRSCSRPFPTFSSCIFDVRTFCGSRFLMPSHAKPASGSPVRKAFWIVRFSTRAQSATA